MIGTWSTRDLIVLPQSSLATYHFQLFVFIPFISFVRSATVLYRYFSFEFVTVSCCARRINRIVRSSNTLASSNDCMSIWSRKCKKERERAREWKDGRQVQHVCHRAINLYDQISRFFTISHCYRCLLHTSRSFAFVRPVESFDRRPDKEDEKDARCLFAAGHSLFQFIVRLAFGGQLDGHFLWFDKLSSYFIQLEFDSDAWFLTFLFAPPKIHFRCSSFIKSFECSSIIFIIIIIMKRVHFDPLLVRVQSDHFRLL